MPVQRPVPVGTETTAISTTATASFTIAPPSGVVDGETLILEVAGQSSTITADFAASGWSRITVPFATAGDHDTSHRIIGAYAYPVGTGGAAALPASWTFTSTDSASGGRIVASMRRWQNVDQASIATLRSGVSANASGQAITVSTGNATEDGGVLLTLYNAQWSGTIDYTIASGPASMTQLTSLVSQTGSGSKTSLAVYYQNVDTGAIADKTLTWNGAQAQTAGVSVLLRGANTTVTPPVVVPIIPPTAVRVARQVRMSPLAPAQVFAGPTLHVAPGPQMAYTTDGAGTLAYGACYYTSAPGVVSSPLEIRPVPRGYATVADMLANAAPWRPFFVGHRGSSLEFPEMSLYGYSQAAFWGCGALEVSVARTSDGVWFGLHDADLTRTSGAAVTPSSLTWAQLQANYSINTNNPTGQAAQPYMPLFPASVYATAGLPVAAAALAGTPQPDLMTAYYSSHVLFLDPKVAVASITELLNILAVYPSPTTRIVAKYYGAGTSAWSSAARARGYVTEGYFYEGDDVASWQSQWDILGYPPAASQANYDMVKAFGKPILANETSTLAVRNTALQRGASGVVASKVTAVMARTP